MKAAGMRFVVHILLILLQTTLKCADALNCYQQNAVSGVVYNVFNNLFTCPLTVNQCYKYICTGSVYYIQKGCLDPTSPTQNCQVSQVQCSGQGGSGTCYTCDSDRCNSVISSLPHGAIHRHFISPLLMLFTSYLLKLIAI